MVKGIIFSIERGSFVDGPGIRTVIFMKGCPLRCLWCHNPEGQNPYPEYMYDSNGIRKIVGEIKTVREVFDIVSRDRLFYEYSGGGITVSGGEPLFQPEFVLALFKECKEYGIHTALDTSGYASWERFKKILKYTDLLLYDLKVLDPEKHLAYTGGDLSIILRNLKKCDEVGIPIWIRTPVVPNYTSNEDNISRIAEFISNLKNVERFELLSYHSPEEKYKRLGRKYQLTGLEPPPLETLEKLREIALSKGLKQVFYSP